MSEEERPKWPFETSIKTARWLYQNRVTSIVHRWEMTSADTSRDWLELHSDKGSQIDVRTDFFRNNPDFEFKPYHAGLVEQKRQYGVGCKNISEFFEKLDAWERKNKQDRLEYERLKKKFAEETQ